MCVGVCKHTCLYFPKVVPSVALAIEAKHCISLMLIMISSAISRRM